jgi:hypothetical protein
VSKLDRGFQDFPDVGELPSGRWGPRVSKINFDKGRFLRRIEEDFGDTTIGEAADRQGPFDR